MWLRALTTMRRRVSLPTLGLLVGLGIVASMAGLTYRHLSSLDDLEGWVSHTRDVLETSQTMVIAVADAARARRAFATARDDLELAPYRSAVARVTAAQRELRVLIADHPAQQQRMVQIDAVIAMRLDQLEVAVRDARSHAFSAEEEVTFTSAGIVLTTRLSSLVGALDAEERRHLTERTTAMTTESASVKRTLVLGFSASISILFLAFLVSRREVLRRRRSEEALAERERHLAATLSTTKASELRFQRLVEAAPDAIVIADPQGRISIVNHQAGALFGYAAGELIGQPVELLIPERLRERHVDHRRGYEQAPAVRAMGSGLSLLARRKDGTVCPVEVSLSPLHTPEGTQVIAAVRDVTRRRELERFRDEYVGYISHDLKNPLSVIVLQARVLARSLDRHGSAEEKRSVGVIAESAAFIDNLVRELLEMAYVESDQIEIHPEPVELAGFLESVLERAVSTSDRARVRLEITEPSTVSAEPSRIERVVANLMQNALKYSPPGSPIVVRLAAVDDRAVVSVIDRGPGIAPDERSYVFDKYKRASSARTTEGLGLGLYISRKIIEAHGGEIGVDSAPGQGASFFLRLPRIAAAPPRAGASPATPPPRDELRGLKVLLVDDEANAIAALVALLEDEGLDVSSATSGERALTLAAARRPDVAVIDVQMPGMSGLTLLSRLREHDPGLQAVIMSGHLADHAGIAEARASGGVAYVGKPVDLDELLRTLGRLVGVSRT